MMYFRIIIKYNMRSEIKILASVIVLLFSSNIDGVAQRVLPYTKFTWEGAFTGNKAVWGGGDIQNTYTYKGVDFKVEIIDPNNQNTTPTSPSDYHDYTKTNTFYGRGNFALQIKTEESKSPTLLKFSFSKPINLDSFQIWDIDMLQSAKDDYNTYVDSVSIRAKNTLGDVALTLTNIKPSRSFTIDGQNAVANFIKGVNGNILHNDSTGAVNVSTLKSVEELIVSLSNGSQDDGKSNSHAVKITGFKFQEVLGAVSGTVINQETGLPLAGATIKLVDINGLVITNRNNAPMQATTGADGKYYFDYLPIDTYTIREINPSGYDSYSDLDGTNDDVIFTQVTLAQLVSNGNDFRDIATKPLAAKIYDFNAQCTDQNKVLVSWSAASQFETAKYVLSVSTDGENFEDIIDVAVNPDGMYEIGLEYPYDGLSYLKLTEVDVNGGYTFIDIETIIQNNIDIRVFPNPVTDILNVSNHHFDRYEIHNSTGTLMISGAIRNQTETYTPLYVSGLSQGHYMITLYNADQRVSKKFVKE